MLEPRPIRIGYPQRTGLTDKLDAVSLKGNVSDDGSAGSEQASGFAVPSEGVR